MRSEECRQCRSRRQLFRCGPSSLRALRATPDECVRGYTIRSERSSEPEQIRRLYKKLPAVVDVAIACRQDKSRYGIDRQIPAQVPHVGVVANVNRRPRMNKVSDQKIRIEILRRRQRTDRL